jgi:PAS domain S-box-containing protein
MSRLAAAMTDRRCRQPARAEEALTGCPGHSTDTQPMIAAPHLDDDIRTILAASPDGALVGENKRIILWNRAATEIMGYTATEALGRMCCELFADHSDAGGPLQDPASVVISAETPVRAFDVHTATKTGRPLWLHVTVFPVQGQRGASLVVHLFRDVTSTRQLVDLMRRRPAASSKSRATSVPGHGPLTRRELEVLRLTAQGLHTAPIAQRLHISRATVRNHVQNILWKLEVHNRLEAVAYAARHGVL